MTENRSVPHGEPCSPPKSGSLVQAAAIREHEQAIRDALLHTIKGPWFLMRPTEHEDDCAGCKAEAALDALVAVVAAAGPEKEDSGGVRDASEGVALIEAERLRQTDAEGWTAGHDDDHTDGELAAAAACYAMPEAARELMLDGVRVVDATWPWDREWWKPTPHDRVRELAKAGALIAAEIDRLARLGSSAETGRQENETGAGRAVRESGTDAETPA